MKNYLARRNNENDLGFDFFEDAFGDFFKPAFYDRHNGMPTDVKETENGYELSIGLAGYDKKDLSISLNDGYLTVSAKREEKEENKHNYLRRERSFSCSRSYYVGEELSEEDVKAKYENGVLTIDIPKKEEKKPKPTNIAIE